MKKTKSQISLEYLVVVIFLMTAAFILFIYVNQTTQEIIAINKVTNAVNKIAITADEVYALGPGSKLLVEIELPPIVVDYIFDQNRVGFRVKTFDSNSDIWRATKAKLVGGNLPKKEGTYVIKAEMLKNNSRDLNVWRVSP